LSEKSEDIQLIRDFYLILIGIVISYFVGITITYNSIASPIVLLEWIGSHFFQEGPSPNMDSISRSIGVTVIPVGSLFLYGFAWRRYDRFLRHLEKKGKQIHLWKEVPIIAFLGVSPIGILLFFSPSIALADYPITLDIERFGISLLSFVFILFFFYRCRQK
jgi:hypothetical protein